MRKLFQGLCLLATVFMMACSGSGKKDGAQEAAEEKPKVKLTMTKSQEVEQIEEYTAIVESDVKNNISSNTMLRIEKILVEVGDVVRKGQLLVQMDESSLRQMKLEIENQKLEFSRTDELYKVGGASKAEWDNAKTQLDIKETAYQNMLENVRLVSPIDGVVTAKNYDHGDMSGSLPILTVESLAPVKMLVHISEGHYPEMKTGMSVQVKVDTYGDEVFDGKVSIVYPTIDPATHTFPVEITLSNSDNRVRPGMFARATVSFGKAMRTLVPDQAIVKQMGSGDYYVYVYQKDGTVSRNKVVLGRRLESVYEVIEGVEANQQIVVAGQNRLANGTAVEVVK